MDLTFKDEQLIFGNINVRRDTGFADNIVRSGLSLTVVPKTAKKM